MLGVGAATGGFWSAHTFLDKGQASLLYLPVVLACAVRFGFGPAVMGAGLSFLCWNFFFLPPFYTLVVADPRDWLSLLVFLVAAVTTAQLAARAREQTRQAQAREAEIATLFQASETLSREVRADRLLSILTTQLETLCHATHCWVLKAAGTALLPTPEVPSPVRHLAEAAFAHDQTIGFGNSGHLWARALAAETKALPGICVPLHTASGRVGVLYVGPRDDDSPYSPLEERLILTLANHAAVVIARDLLAAEAAQATALREADVLKDSLLSLVSHELRTPLASIKASASGLLQPGSDWGEEARREALRAIDTEADRLGGLVGSLLDLSRLEGGAWQPRKDWCDLLEVVGTALDRLPPAEAARVIVEVPVDLPLLQADYTQIALVLTNLLENAVKYTPPGSRVVLSLAESVETPGVTVRVRDFGSGLVPGEEARLFERFYRSPRHQRSTVRGTGLGLALCLAVVQAHGGRVWAANAPAADPPGAVFSFFLPPGDTP